MGNPLRSLTTKIFQKPQRLFLIDGIGALVSAFLLGIVLMQLQPYFGIPKQTLLLLACIPCFFAMYDFICFRSKLNNISLALRIIATLNLAYCCLSLALAFVHLQELTALGWVYIISEIGIVLGLALFELKIANSLSQA